MKNMISSTFLLLLAAVLLQACQVLPVANAGAGDGADMDGVGASQSDESTVVIAEGRLLPRETAWLAFGGPGLVAEVLVGEGEQVSQGDVLARLNGRERVEAQLAAAELERLGAQQALDDLLEKAPLASSAARQVLVAAEKTAIDARRALKDLDTEAFQKELDDARLAVEDAQDELEDAQEEIDRYIDLGEENPSRTDAEDALEDAQQAYGDAVEARDLLLNQLEARRASVAQAEAALEDARREAGVRASGPDPGHLALARSHLEHAAAQVKASRAALEDLELVASFDGTVLEIVVTTSERVLPSQPVVLLADRSAWFVETSDVTEMEVVQIQLGSRVSVTPDALPELELTGVVEKISEAYTEKGGDILYTVRIRLDEADPRLRWGLTVEVRLPKK